MPIARLALLAAPLAVAAVAPPAPVAAQACHPAYGGCLPIVDDLDCAEIGYAVLPVYDADDDPYGLDVAYGPGNGWTCDGIG